MAKVLLTCARIEQYADLSFENLNHGVWHTWKIWGNKRPTLFKRLRL